MINETIVKNDNKQVNEHNLYKQIERLLEENGKIMKNAKVTNNTINNNNYTQINQTNNIVLNNYGDEDLSHLTQAVMDKLISSPADMISNLTKLIHFNSNKPENMNMYIPSRKQKHIKIFKENKWTYEAKADRIPDLIDRNYLLLDTHYEEGGGNLRINGQNKKNYKKYQELLDNKDPKIMKKEEETCEYEILNNSDVVIDLHKLNH